LEATTGWENPFIQYYIKDIKKGLFVTKSSKVKGVFVHANMLYVA